ncbi:MAG: aminopeptidase [Spirochaeta sp.]|nr:aminopeptidase [Spirochaeta sp.]
MTEIERYASLLVRVAVNLQEGQRLVIWKAPVDAAPFVRLLAERAYEAGAEYVEVFWQDDRLELARMTHSRAEVLAKRPYWEVHIMEKAAADGAAFLFFDCTCAGVFDRTPASVVARALELENEQLQRVWHFFVRNAVNWSIVTVPTESWARKVYPDLLPSEGVTALWEDIFFACRVDTDDFIERWAAHRGALETRSDILNELHLQALQFSAPGTELRVALPAGHIWRHPGFVSADGIPFIADIPIEEIFTLPERTGVNGTVTATRPLVVSGRTMTNFSFRFEGGKLVELIADDHDREMLERLISSDEGALRLGEVALVANDSLVSQLNKPFFNTIFDENASCHLALGRAYRFCLEDGEEMTDEDFITAGGNLSGIHIDFMIGSGELNVDGIDSNGAAHPILRSGLWVVGAR